MFLSSGMHYYFHRITEWSGLEGTSVGHLVQPSHWSRVTYSRLHFEILKLRTASDYIQSLLDRLRKKKKG